MVCFVLKNYWSVVEAGFVFLWMGRGFKVLAIDENLLKTIKISLQLLQV